MDMPGVNLKDSGKFEEIEAILRNTLGLREQVLGLEHPDTLISTKNLAGILRK